MNLLETYIQQRGFGEVATMNRLQEHGVVSDESVMAAEVASVDQIRAVGWLGEELVF